MNIRLFQSQDAEQIAHLFHDTVRQVNCRDYSASQVAAWAPDDLYFRNWRQVCADRYTFVAEDVAEAAGLILGFGELEPNGHIDCFYCHKDYQGRGVGRQLYRAIENQAIDLGLDRLFVEASITARPFFERLGFAVVQAQQVTCRGKVFTNYAMQKLVSH